METFWAVDCCRLIWQFKLAPPVQKIWKITFKSKINENFGDWLNDLVQSVSKAQSLQLLSLSTSLSPTLSLSISISHSSPRCLTVSPCRLAGPNFPSFIGWTKKQPDKGGKRSHQSSKTKFRLKLELGFSKKEMIPCTHPQNNKILFYFLKCLFRSNNQVASLYEFDDTTAE